MRRTYLLLVCTLIPYLLPAQQQPSTSGIEFLAGGLNVPPLIASTYEPRVGFIFQAGNSDLRLDIGNSIDLISIPAGLGSKLTFGADFFTWTALRQDENFHFPVDAVDYLFGLNLSYSEQLSSHNEFQARLRWSHISAHLVDGRYQKETADWREDQLPRVYSREYFELIAAIDYEHWLRPYLGVTYVYHIDPADLGKMVYQAGVEATLPHNEDCHLHPYIAYDFRLFEVGALAAAHSAQIGLKTGDWQGRGLNFFVALYSGMSFHGEYHDQRISYWGPGITIDF